MNAIVKHVPKQGSNLRFSVTFDQTSVDCPPALFPQSTSTLSKRKATTDVHPTVFSDLANFDAENIDPSLLTSPKRSKSASGAPIKPQHFFLQSTTSGTPVASTPGLDARKTLTPRRISTNVKAATPRTAPAGRSPTRKRNGLFSKRRTSAPFTRINPPAFGASAAPFSIDAALSGSVPHYTPKPARHEPSTLSSPPKKAPWFFEIHEDTADEELGNLMDFGTQTLDISDDESKARELNERGKENIPPTSGEVMVAESQHARRCDVMTDADRTPLGDLDVKQYFAEGCDGNSICVVPADDDLAMSTSKDASAVDLVRIDTTAAAVEAEARDPSPTEALSKNANQEAWADLLARVDAQSKTLADTAFHHRTSSLDVLVGSDETGEGKELPEVEIWESESAKADDDDAVTVVVTETVAEGLLATSREVMPEELLEQEEVL